MCDCSDRACPENGDTHSPNLSTVSVTPSPRYSRPAAQLPRLPSGPSGLEGQGVGAERDGRYRESLAPLVQPVVAPCCPPPPARSAFRVLGPPSSLEPLDRSLISARKQNLMCLGREVQSIFHPRLRYFSIPPSRPRFQAGSPQDHLRTIILFRSVSIPSSLDNRRATSLDSSRPIHRTAALALPSSVYRRRQLEHPAYLPALEIARRYGRSQTQFELSSTPISKLELCRPSNTLVYHDRQ